jgi:hypothetical protein
MRNFVLTLNDRASAEIRRELLETAERYERLALHAEGRPRGGRALHVTRPIRIVDKRGREQWHSNKPAFVTK